MVRIGINGFGRIGRLVLREAMRRRDVEVAAINDLAEASLLAYLYARDSVHGRVEGEVSIDDCFLLAAGRRVRMVQEKDPGRLPWKELGVDVVIEATGAFRGRKDAARHLEAGARRVLLSAPSSDADFTLVMGVNHSRFDSARHHVVSNASCTTNALAPVAMILHEQFGVERGFILTVHAYTSSQALVDSPKRKRRRSRAAALNLVPTSTGAAAAVGLVLPELAGRLDGLAVRSPVADGSLLELTVVLSRPTDALAVNAAFAEAGAGRLAGILRFEPEDGLVSSDILGETHSVVVDGPLTAVSGNLAHVIAWYDNEYGYACRMLDAAVLLAS